LAFDVALSSGHPTVLQAVAKGSAARDGTDLRLARRGTPGLNLHLSSPVESIARNGTGYTIHTNDEAYEIDAIVVAAEPAVAADLLRDLVNDAVTTKLRACRYSDYAHAQVCYAKNPWPNSRVSVALPANQPDCKWGAAVLQSHRHPSSVPQGAEAVGVYFYTPPLAYMTDQDIKRAAVDAVAHAYGPAPEPTFVELFHYKRGLSIAGPGHYATMNSVHTELPMGLNLAADYFAHAGVEAAILSGELAANRVTRRYREIGSQPTPKQATVPSGDPMRTR
jgi:oxygen-dependent protoporphyrinogen oxidase